MDAIDLLRYQIRETYAWLEMTLSDITEEQANWQPPGIANPIGAVWKGLDVYLLHGINHPRLHGGEIACLKGMQGAPAWQDPRRSGIEPPL